MSSACARKTFCVAVKFVRFLFSPTAGPLCLEPFALAPSAAPAEAPLTKSHPPPPGVPVSTLDTLRQLLKRNFPPPPPEGLNPPVVVFGLWRVCFPPCLVRPGRRLPVQGLSEGSLGYRDGGTINCSRYDWTVATNLWPKTLIGGRFVPGNPREDPPRIARSSPRHEFEWFPGTSVQFKLVLPPLVKSDTANKLGRAHTGIGKARTFSLSLSLFRKRWRRRRRR